MLGHLVLALVLVQVRDLHPLQVVEPLAGQQALVQAVPVAELDEVRVRQAEFEAEGPLGPLGDVVGELVALEVEGRDLPHHPVVELLVGVLRAEELLVSWPAASAWWLASSACANRSQTWAPTICWSTCSISRAASFACSVQSWSRGATRPACRIACRRRPLVGIGAPVGDRLQPGADWARHRTRSPVRPSDAGSRRQHVRDAGPKSQWQDCLRRRVLQAGQLVALLLGHLVPASFGWTRPLLGSTLADPRPERAGWPPPAGSGSACSARRRSAAPCAAPRSVRWPR